MVHLLFMSTHSLFQPSPFSVHKDAACNPANPHVWLWQPPHNANGIGKVANCRCFCPASPWEEFEPQGWILAALVMLVMRSWASHQHQAPRCAVSNPGKADPWLLLLMRDHGTSG